MKTNSNLLLIIFSFLLIFKFSFAKNYKLNFGSRNSAFKISSGAKFNVTSTNLTFTDGTLNKNYNAQISGNKINFANSILEDCGVENLMTGIYDPAASRNIFLGGGGFLKTEPGNFFEKINVFGWGNKIEGQPIFLSNDAIRLEHEYSELTLNVQSALNTNIELNGGTITLSSDLSFADDKNFTGSGIVNLFGHSIKFGSKPDLNLTHTINWKNASDINLTQRTNLSGTWNFVVGNAVLNGNGNILDLSSGGTLFVGSGVTAEITDVVIKGLGINKGWIDFQDDTGKIIMSDVTLELDDRFRVSKGSFYVEGPVTAILKNYDLTFDQLATLTVDGVTLWKDNVQYAGDPNAGDIVFGSLSANRALVDSGVISTILPGEFIEYNSNAIIKNTKDIRYNSNAILNVSGPNLSVLEGAVRANSRNIVYNSNAILSLGPLSLSVIEGSVRANSRNIVYNSNAIVNLQESVFDDNPLTQGSLTTDISLKKSYFIHPKARIFVDGNITINGNGAVLIFSDPDHSQFVVAPGRTVTLKNIQFDRINDKTIDLRWKLTHSISGWTLNEGQLNIGEDVVFGLSENLTFSQGLINIITKDDGTPNIFDVCGVDGKRRFTLNPNSVYKSAVLRDNKLIDRLNSFGDPVLLKLNENTMNLVSIDFWGMEYINKSVRGLASGALGLSGDASVNAEKSNDMVFVAENLDNQLRLLTDDLIFTGQLLYADHGDNSLMISSVLTERIISPADDQNRRIPQINFGTGFVNLTSLDGKAILIFSDPQIRINNSPNGFVVEENSLLIGNKIEVYGDYIWDFYDPATGKGPFVLEVADLVAPDPALNHVPLVSSVTLSLAQFKSGFENFDLIPKYKTALNLQNRQKKRQ